MPRPNRDGGAGLAPRSVIMPTGTALRATRPSLGPEAEEAVGLASGDLLGDRYCIEVPIGRGGWADVYRATDRALARRVAIKVLRDRSESARARFVREARLAAAVTHANVAVAFDVGRTDRDDPFLVMELLEGESLASACTNAVPSAGRLIAIADQVLAALSMLEALGIVHRDLKPDNVFLHGPRRVVKIVDFGIATAGPEVSLAPIEPLAEVGSIVGTPQYMAPEQIDGRGADHRSDLYALGVIMYEMACGRRPHDALTPGALFAAILRDPVPDIRTLRADFPQELAAAIHRALEPEPDRRFQSAAEMAAALAAIDTAKTDPIGTACEPERPSRDALPTRRESVFARSRGAERSSPARSERSIVRVAMRYLLGLGFALALLTLAAAPSAGGEAGASAPSSVHVRRLVRVEEGALAPDRADSRPRSARIPAPPAERADDETLRESSAER